MYSYDRFDVVELAEYIFDQIEKDQVELRKTRPQLSSSGLYVTKKDIESRKTNGGIWIRCSTQQIFGSGIFLSGFSSQS